MNAFVEYTAIVSYVHHTAGSPIALRRAQEDDLPLLYRVYASTRQDELAIVEWDEAQKEWFLRMQFDLQTRAYAQTFPGADCQVVLRDGQPIGRLMVERTLGQIILVDIALLPEHRHAGIGAALVRMVLNEAAAASKPVVLHVEKSNRARFLYERLGFVMCAADDVYLEMRWPAHGIAP